MKFWQLLILLVFLVNCAKQIKPGTNKIEVFYLGSLYDDLYKNPSLLASINQSSVIKVGHLLTSPPFMGILLAKLGFAGLTNLDFVIGRIPLSTTDLAPGFFVQKSMGYAIENYQGIRFAILSQDKDSLTIDDQLETSIIAQRSDVLWTIDKDFFDGPPLQITFFIARRQLTDTAVKAIKLKPDTGYLRRLENFRSDLDALLNKKIGLGNRRLDEYLLSKVAAHEDVGTILYPKNLFHDRTERDSISLKEILDRVTCEMKFAQVLSMTEKEITALSEDNNYHIWRAQTANKCVLLPNENGQYFFDLFWSLKDEN